MLFREIVAISPFARILALVTLSVMLSSDIFSLSGVGYAAQEEFMQGDLKEVKM